MIKNSSNPLGILLIAIYAISCNPNYTPQEEQPVAYLNFSIESSNDFRIPSKITFINLSSIDSALGEPEFLWDFGNGESISTQEDTIYYIYDIPGEYDVSLIVNTPKMEPDTLTAPLTIKPLYEYVFSESFEGYEPNVVSGDSLSSSWIVIDNDGGTPGDPLLYSKAWKIIYSEKMASNVAVANSYYTNTPIPDADDWMISPAIQLLETDSFTVQWKALSLTKSGNWPDSYQVYISTTTQDIAGCTYLLKEVIDEWWSINATDIEGEGIHPHKYDISEFTGETIYLGFRLTTPAPGGSQLGVDSILVTSYYDYIPIEK